jgi:tetratricopeptide (TPR) repeat protein
VNALRHVAFAAALFAGCKERPAPAASPPTPSGPTPPVADRVHSSDSDRTLEASLAKLERLRQEQLGPRHATLPDAAVQLDPPRSSSAPASPHPMPDGDGAATKWAEVAALGRADTLGDALAAARDAWELDRGGLSPAGVRALDAVAAKAASHNDEPWDSSCERAAEALDRLPQADSEARTLLATLWAQLGSRALAARDFERARKLAQRALQLEPVFPPAFYVLGRSAYLTTDFDEAQNFYDRAARGSPPNEARAYRNILEALERERASLPSGRQATKDFVVLFDQREDEEAARITLEALQRARTDVGAIYDAYPHWPIAIVLFPGLTFDRVNHASWAAGFYDGRVKMPSRGATAAPLQFRQTLFHEYAHGVFDHVTQGGHDAPAWLNEGLASIAGNLPAPAPLGGCRLGHTFPLRSLERGFGALDRGSARAAYLEARHASERLQETFGADRVHRLLVNLAQEKRFAPAFEKSFGISYARWAEQFDAEKDP